MVHYFGDYIQCVYLILAEPNLYQLQRQRHFGPFKKLPGCRFSQFNAIDKPALKPLPSLPYDYVDIKKCQVRLDYHVEIDKHFYSVPHVLIHKCVEYHLGRQLVEIFYQGERVASHVRSNKLGVATTVLEHMPHAHRQHQQWTPLKFAQWSKAIGPSMEQIAAHLIQHKRNPECCYRIHLGFLNLSKRYPKFRLERACQYALTQHLYTFSQIQSILKTNIDQAPIHAVNDKSYRSPIDSHAHVRGSDYYSLPKENDHVKSTN